MDALAKLFGSSAKVKLMRLFLFHPEEAYEPKEVATYTRIRPETAKQELERLAKAGMLKKVTSYRESKSKTTKDGKPAKKKVTGWQLDERFPHLRALQTMLINTKPLHNDELVKRFQRAGKIKLIIVAGIFLQDEDSRLDLLVVGDKLQESRVREVVRDLESEIGCELVYAAFKTEDFDYRMSVYDKLVRDVLDYNHERVLDKIGVE